MRLSYLLYAYMVFTLVEITSQIMETWRQERKFIKEGGSPLGDSTYYIYFTNLFFRLLAGAIVLLIWYNAILPADNIWLLLLIILGIYLGLVWGSALIAAIPITLVTNYKIRKHREKLNNKAPYLMDKFNEKHNK